MCCIVCFFFQAEDGIRGWSVTGVQTLLFRSRARAVEITGGTDPILPTSFRIAETSAGALLAPAGDRRSEERRVGKEGSARRGPGGGENSTSYGNVGSTRP